jgi:hypothetical protein
MQVQVKIADCQNGANEKNADGDHQYVGVTGSGDEARQMMGGEGMKGFAHAVLHFEKASDAPGEKLDGRPATPEAAIFAESWNLASASLSRI